MHQRLKVSAVGLNQTVYDWSGNVDRIFKAIDRAVEDRADILLTEELSLVGYPADDYHQWNKNNEMAWESLTATARYAHKKDPNLVVSVGTPWHHEDKSKLAHEPEYNLHRRPFNTHVLITAGRIVSFSAKSLLADGPAEYESRHFSAWPITKATISITLPDQSQVPFGKPIVHLVDDTCAVSVWHEICADGWPGIRANGDIDHDEQIVARHLFAYAAKNDISVVLAPSASKPEPAIDKEKIRSEGICIPGSRCCGVYVYTNNLGSASGTYAAEGGQIFSQNGRIIHRGQRYSFKNMAYSSAVVDVSFAHRGTVDSRIPHHFTSHTDTIVGGPKTSDLNIDDEHRAHEEYLRSIALWLRDYLAKQHWAPQGYVVSLSGGKDSAYVALAVSAMIDLDVQENGLIDFFERFHFLKYKDKVLKIYQNAGEIAAIRALKQHLLTCVYLPTENSSEGTLRSAQFLIEGGKLPNGTDVEGIGGTFYVVPVQAMLDEAVAAVAGIDLNATARENVDTILGVGYSGLSAEERVVLARAKLLNQIKATVHGTTDDTISCQHCIPTWKNPSDDLTLQNLQARIRVPIPWAIANRESKIALASSNASEAALGYTTAGGDLHMGGANPIGGIPKNIITTSLAYMEHHGLIGLSPVSALYWVNREKPSAELRPIKNGQQTDEEDIGMSYAQSQLIETALIIGRKTPLETFQYLKKHPLFANDLSALKEKIVRFAQRWATNQFKRVMAPLAPHVGTNVDPHQSVRTTVLGDHFRTGCDQILK